jgi:hypothetical protein
MKRLILLLLMTGIGFAAGAFLVNRQQAARHARELEVQRAAWEAETAELAAALEQARARRPAAAVIAPSATPVAPAVVAAPPDPTDLLKQLAALQIAPGPGQGRAMREVIALLSQLAQLGPPALPAIRQFLVSGQDVAYEAPGGKGLRDVKSLTDALLPPSLRFALFEVVRQIGGEDAEQILAEALSATRRGLELAYLTEVLEQMAPGKFRDTALAAARSLLAGGTGADRLDRDYLYGVLRRFNDATFVSTAQAQLVQPNGQLDRAALRYLQQTLGEQSLALAAQTYQDSRLTEPGAKEPLARLALAFVGASPQAVPLWHNAILDPSLTADQKRNLVEDLNEDGLVNKKTPTPEDLTIIARRYALTQAYLQQDYVLNDRMLNAAFREADKDLRNLLQKAAAAAANPGAAPVPAVK